MIDKETLEFKQRSLLEKLDTMIGCLKDHRDRLERSGRINSVGVIQGEGSILNAMCGEYMALKYLYDELDK